MTRRVQHHRFETRHKQARGLISIALGVMVAMPPSAAKAEDPTMVFDKSFKAIEGYIQEDSCDAAMKELDSGLATFLNALESQESQALEPAENYDLYAMCTSINTVAEGCSCAETFGSYQKVQTIYGQCADTGAGKYVIEKPRPCLNSSIPGTGEIPDSGEVHSTTPPTIVEPPPGTGNPPGTEPPPGGGGVSPPGGSYVTPTGSVQPGQSDSSKPTKPLLGWAIGTGVLSLATFASMGAMAAVARRNDPTDCANTYGSYCRVYESAVSQGVPSGDDDNLCGPDVDGELKQACSQRSGLISGVYTSAAIGGALAATSVTLAIVFLVRKKKATKRPDLSFGIGRNRSLVLGARWRF